MGIVKYKKKHKKKKFLNNIKKFLGSLQYGFYGIKATNYGILTSKQIESVRQIFVKLTKRCGKLFLRLYFHHPLTIKPLLSRMGKGVGVIKSWISYIKKGTIFLEILGVKKKLILIIFTILKFRLPIKIHLINREVFKIQKIA